VQDCLHEFEAGTAPQLMPRAISTTYFCKQNLVIVDELLQASHSSRGLQRLSTLKLLTKCCVLDQQSSHNSLHKMLSLEFNEPPQQTKTLNSAETSYRKKAWLRIGKEMPISDARQ